MRTARARLVLPGVVTAFLLSSGCSPNVPSAEDLQAELQRRIATEANGCMQLLNVEKTNGYQSPAMANTYVVLFNGLVEFAKDCKWSSPMFEQGKHSSFATTITDAQARKKGGFWGEFFNMSQKPGAPFTEGTRVRITGEQAFIKTEKGYRPLADLLSMTELERILSDRDIQKALAQQLHSWNPSALAFMEAQWAANPGADLYRSVNQIAREAAERGASSAEIRAALERELVPRFFKELPSKDGWGNPIEYLVDERGGFYLRSPGKDGEYTWTPQAMMTATRGLGHYYDPEDYSGDIVFCVDSAQSRICSGPDIQGVNPFWTENRGQ